MKTGWVRHRGALAVLLVLAAGMVHSSGRQAQQTREAVAVDFYVFGPDGRSVPDLRLDEVSVKLDGRMRVVRALQHVVQAPVPTGDPLAPVPELLPLPFATNAAAESGRSIIIVIDDESFRPGRERPLRGAVGRFLGSLTPRDRVALLTVPHGGMKTDLTTNHDRVSSALSVLIGHGPERETGSEGACRTRTVLESLEGMLLSLAGGEGPTTVIFISAGELGPRRDAPVTLAPGMCELTTRHFQRMGDAAARARAHFFVVQPEEIMAIGREMNENIAGTGFTGSDNPLEGLEHIAGVTAGHRVTLAAAGDATLVQIVRETASYYSATIEATPQELDGMNHGLDVRLSRSGVKVRARPQLNFPKADAPGPRPAAKTPADMLREGRPFRDVLLRAVGFSSLNSPDGRVKVIAAAEPIDPTVKLAALSAALFNGQGQLLSQWDATPESLASNPVLAALIVPPGSYRLRVAAVDSAGRSGATDAEIRAELTPAGPLTLSSMVLGLSRSGTFQPKLQFSSEPVAIGYLEIYGGTPGAAIGAIVELASTVNGPPMVVTRLAIEATSDPSKFLATGAIPIGALPPGDYIVRALVGLQDQPMGRVIRTIRKVAQ